ncbi:MAG: hypothetical protein QOJ16_1763 [Acidobacteriota bacterium]|nr:hypothetical protein [Acidobacteriota bacterium]
MSETRVRSILRGAPLVLLAGAALSTALPRPAAADWLITREGARVETHGPWQVKGKVVVFTSADGTLSSLRVAQVDLDASKKATTDKQKMVEEDISTKPAEKRKSVRSITDKDVTHPTESAADGAAGAPPQDGKDAKDADAKGAKSDTKVNRGKSSPVVVGSWQKVERDQKDGIELFGTLKNESSDIASQVVLAVTLLDEAGGVVGTTEAILTANAIEPGSATNFRAIFSGVYTFASAKFDVKSAPLKLQAVAPPPEKSKS